MPVPELKKYVEELREKAREKARPDAQVIENGVIYTLKDVKGAVEEIPWTQEELEHKDLLSGVKKTPEKPVSCPVLEEKVQAAIARDENITVAMAPTIQPYDDETADIPETEDNSIPELGIELPNCGDTGRWIDDYISWSRRFSPNSPYSYHEGCAVWLLSTIAARRVRVPFGSATCHTGLYLVLYGRSTIHAKTSTLSLAERVLEASGHNWLLLPRNSTAEYTRLNMSGMTPVGYERMTPDEQRISRLKMQFAGQRGWVADEFGSQIAKVLSQNSYMSMVKDLLRHFFDYKTVESVGTISRGQTTVNRPYLAFIASMTPDDMKTAYKNDMGVFGDGFLARFAFCVPPDDDNPVSKRMPVGDVTIPTEILKPLSEWTQRLKLPEAAVSVETRMNERGKEETATILKQSDFVETPIMLSEAARELYYRYDDALRGIISTRLQEMAGNKLDSWYGRAGTMALRVACLIASLEGYQEIGDSHLSRAIRIVENWRRGIHYLYRTIAKSGKDTKREAQDAMIRLIHEHSTDNNGKGIVASRIAQYAPFKTMDKTAVKTMLETLITIGDVLKVNGAHFKIRQDVTPMDVR